METNEMKFIDLQFVRRLEMASAQSGKNCARAAQVSHPEIGAVAEDIAGGIAVYAGVDSPVTQALGVGLDGPVEDAELDRLEEFYRSRGAVTAIELCPFAGIPLYEALAKREFRLLEVSNVFFRDLSASEKFPPPPAGVTVREAAPADEYVFTQTVAKGFAELSPITPALLDIMTAFYRAGGHRPFIAFVDGVAAGGASVFTFDGVAGMFGAATLPEFRGRGVQGALLAARLRWAAQHGCDIAKGITLPGSASHRNHERLGFRVAYTRTKLVRNYAASSA
jgi:GNAT superfamily N-acetyltransferase